MDEGGNIHSREFISEELILNDAEDLANVLKRESSHVKVERLKSGTTDVVNLIPRSDQTPREIVLPVPKSGARPLDIRISSEVAHDLLTKEQPIQLSDIVHDDKRIIVHIHDVGAIISRRGAKLPLFIGAAILAASFYYLYVFRATQLQIALGVIVAFIGVGFMFVAMINVIIQSVQQSQTGEATGMNTLFRTIGGTVGPIITGVYLAQYVSPLVI